MYSINEKVNIRFCFILIDGKYWSPFNPTGSNKWENVNGKVVQEYKRIDNPSMVLKKVCICTRKKKNYAQVLHVKSFACSV